MIQGLKYLEPETGMVREETKEIAERFTCVVDEGSGARKELGKPKQQRELILPVALETRLPVFNFNVQLLLLSLQRTFS